MAKKFREKLRKLNPFTRPATLEELPKPLPANPDQRLVRAVSYTHLTLPTTPYV